MIVTLQYKQRNHIVNLQATVRQTEFHSQCSFWVVRSTAHCLRRSPPQYSLSLESSHPSKHCSKEEDDTMRTRMLDASHLQQPSALAEEIQEFRVSKKQHCRSVTRSAVFKTRQNMASGQSCGRYAGCMNRIRHGSHRPKRHHDPWSKRMFCCCASQLPECRLTIISIVSILFCK